MFKFNTTLWSAALIMVFLFDAAVMAFLLNFRINYDSIFEMPAAFGYYIESIAIDGRYVAKPATGGIEFFAARHPFLPYLYAVLWKLTGSATWVMICKNVLLGGALIVIIKRFQTHFNIRPALAAIGLALMFMVPFNAMTMLTLNYEEAVLSFLVPAVFALGFMDGSPTRLFSLAMLLGAIYLTKSSAFLFCFVAAVFLLVSSTTVSPVWRIMPLALVTLAAIGWGGYSLHTTGTFAFGSTGSSTNGWNLFKGNNQFVADLYPDTHLDDLPREAFRGVPKFQTEWERHHYFSQRAKDFWRENPREALANTGAKIHHFLFGVRDFDFNRNRAVKEIVHVGSMIINRILLFGATALAFYCIAAPRLPTFLRRAGWLHILLVLTYSAPYIIGFVYSRHIVPLFLSSVFFILLMADFSLRTGSRLTEGDRPLRGSWT